MIFCIFSCTLPIFVLPVLFQAKDIEAQVNDNIYVDDL